MIAILLLIFFSNTSISMQPTLPANIPELFTIQLSIDKSCNVNVHIFAKKNNAEESVYANNNDIFKKIKTPQAKFHFANIENQLNDLKHTAEISTKQTLLQYLYRLFCSSCFRPAIQYHKRILNWSKVHTGSLTTLIYLGKNNKYLLEPQIVFSQEFEGRCNKIYESYLMYSQACLDQK